MNDKYEYEIEDCPASVYTTILDPNRPTAPEIQTDILNILNTRGEKGWEFCGADPMGNMVFKRKVIPCDAVEIG